MIIINQSRQENLLWTISLKTNVWLNINVSCLSSEVTNTSSNLRKRHSCIKLTGNVWKGSNLTGEKKNVWIWFMRDYRTESANPAICWYRLLTKRNRELTILLPWLYQQCLCATGCYIVIDTGTSGCHCWYNIYRH